MHIETNTRTTKQEMIVRIKEQYTHGFTLDQLAIMDISYMQQRINKYRWFVYSLQSPTDKDHIVVDPQLITSHLARELGPLIYCHVYSGAKDGLLWIRILLAEPIHGRFEYIPTDRNETKVVYIAHLLGSNYIIVSQIPNAFRSIVLTCSSLAFKQSKCQPLNLSGSDVYALLNLVMNMSAGGVADYLNQLKEKRPLQHGKISRTVPELEKDLPENFHFLESEEIRERHRKSEEEWGISDPPAIQQIIVKTLMDWKSIGNVKMDIELQGPNILKGLKQLTEFGYVTQIPVQLLNIPRNPRNVIDLNILSDEENDDDITLYTFCY